MGLAGGLIACALCAISRSRHCRPSSPKAPELPGGHYVPTLPRACPPQDIAADVLHLTQRHGLTSLAGQVEDRLYQALDSGLRSSSPNGPLVWQWLALTERLGMASGRALCLNYIKNHCQPLAASLAPAAASAAAHAAIGELQPATVTELLHFALANCHSTYSTSVGQKLRAEDSTAAWEGFAGRSAAGATPAAEAQPRRTQDGLSIAVDNIGAF